ncbi:MAG: LysR substrate-binding domain-containing protein [Roseovarius sp.]
MQKPRLPNLNAMRVFEVAARHENFTRAGEELGLSQSAVSKHVAHLEAALGQPLFIRRHKAISLSAYGREVALAARGAFAQLSGRLASIDTGQPEQITFAADADFIQLWLLDRLFAFERQNPDLRISLAAEIAATEPPATEHHCAVIWGTGGWQGCRFELLFANQLFPVAAPGYFDHLGRPPRMADLTKDMLIHDRTTSWWSSFLAAEGLTDFDPEAGRVYNQTSFCLEAAAQGMGVTIGDEVTTRPYLEAGRLTCPFPARIASPNAYYLVYPAAVAVDGALARFSEWLKTEALAHRAWYSAFWAEQDAGARRDARDRPRPRAGAW